MVLNEDVWGVDDGAAKYMDAIFRNANIFNDMGIG